MNPGILQRNWLYAALFGGILLLALVLRLHGLETTGLWGDQSFTLNTAMRWVNGGDVPLAANKSSVGFVNPPMIEYLYAAALAIRPDILSVSWLTMLGGLAAVAVTGAATTRIFGRRAGLWAMLTFAVAPWAVFWSQLIWNQTMVPAFAALTLAGLLLYITDEPRWYYLVGAAAALAVMTQVHPGSAIQAATTALVLLIYWRRVRWMHVILAAAVFVVLYVPYSLYLAGTGWGDLRAMAGLAGDGSALSSAAALLSLDLIHAQGLWRAAPRTSFFDGLMTVLFLGALALMVWRGIRGWREARAARPESVAVASAQPDQTAAILIILLWFAMPLLFYLRSSVYLHNYYLISQWPAHFMILGVGVDTARRALERLAQKANSAAARHVWRVLAYGPGLLLLVVVAFQVWFGWQYQTARAAGEEKRLQVGQARELIARANTLLAENPACRLVAIGQGHQVENSSLALFAEFTDPARILLADGDTGLPLPRPCAFYLDGRPGSLATFWLSASAEPLAGTETAVGDQVWRFYRKTAEPQPDMSGAPQWANGLALAGSFIGDPAPGEELDVSLTWEIAGEPDGRQYHLGVYLLDGDGAVVAQHDGPGFDSVQWRQGDQFITWHLLPLPEDLEPGNFRAAVALYSWPDVVRTLLDNGQSTADLGPLDIAGP